jgi:hypothetical protein
MPGSRVVLLKDGVMDNCRSHSEGLCRQKIHSQSL